MVRFLGLSQHPQLQDKVCQWVYPDKSFLDPSIDLLAKNLPSAFQTSHLPPQPTAAPSSRHLLPAQWSGAFFHLLSIYYPL